MRTNDIFTPLLLRLVDNKPHQHTDTEAGLITDEQGLRENIRCNLECILNSRKSFLSLSHDLPELESSIMNYGLGDFTHAYHHQRQYQQELCKQIKYLIEHFERRVANVRVQLLDSDKDFNRVLKLQIEATLRTHPHNEKTIFESIFDIHKQQFNFNREASYA